MKLHLKLLLIFASICSNLNPVKIPKQELWDAWEINPKKLVLALNNFSSHLEEELYPEKISAIKENFIHIHLMFRMHLKNIILEKALPGAEFYFPYQLLAADEIVRQIFSGFVDINSDVLEHIGYAMFIADLFPGVLVNTDKLTDEDLEILIDGVKKIRQSVGRFSVQNEYVWSRERNSVARLAQPFWQKLLDNYTPVNPEKYKMVPEKIEGNVKSTLKNKLLNTARFIEENPATWATNSNIIHFCANLPFYFDQFKKSHKAFFSCKSPLSETATETFSPASTTRLAPSTDSSQRGSPEPGFAGSSEIDTPCSRIPICISPANGPLYPPEQSVEPDLRRVHAQGVKSTESASSSLKKIISV